jgi:asparagine synthase (glutamine-hydrolysing)
MCGIAGVISSGQFQATSEDIRKMSNALRHRGPDSYGHWEKDGTVFGHRRLAIVDLSEAGHQPMLSHDEKLVISYNGEIYNHLDIRAELEARGKINWRGHSDSETLVEALSRWGAEKTLNRVNGMFAFACWDIQKRSLLLARDPFGEKPLYYTLQKGAFAFASELTAIRAVKAFNSAPDPAMVSRYLQSWCVPDGRSILQDINKLEPGRILRWRPGTIPVITKYWSLALVAEVARKQPLASVENAISELDALFQDAVKIRMMSDVPIGALLSGGVDSSLVAALMQKATSQPIRTFTIGFDDAAFNEAHHAQAVATHLGTRHETLMLSETEAQAAVPDMGALYDEPFGDSSQVPTYLVSALARKHVTVALTGDGCDELFSGYARHVLAGQAWRSVSKIPMRNMLSKAIGHIPRPLLNLAAKAMSPMIPAGVNPESLPRKLKHSGHLLASNSVNEIYENYMTSWSNPARLMKDGAAPWQSSSCHDLFFETPESSFLYRDSIDYLPNDILVKVDRASMAVSLETRIPALDKRIAAFAWRMPHDMRWREGKGKWLLRQVLFRHVPRELVERPKRGFSVPLDAWLRGPLRTWARDLLSPDLIHSQGLLNVKAVSKQVEDFENGGITTASQIWTILMLQSWLTAKHDL